MDLHSSAALLDEDPSLPPAARRDRPHAALPIVYPPPPPPPQQPAPPSSCHALPPDRGAGQLDAPDALGAAVASPPPQGPVCDQSDSPACWVAPSAGRSTSSPSPLPTPSGCSSAILSPDDRPHGAAPITTPHHLPLLHHTLSAASAAAARPSSTAPIDPHSGDLTDDIDGDSVMEESSAGGPVVAFPTSSTTLPVPMLVDDAEDDFSPNNLVTRPPSPAAVGDAGGGHLGILALFASSQGGEGADNDGGGVTPGSAMLVDTPPSEGGHGHAGDSHSIPTAPSPLAHNHTHIPTVTALAQSLDTPSSQIEQVGVTGVPEMVTVETAGLYMSENTGVAEDIGGSMTSQTSSEPPAAPTPAAASASTPPPMAASADVDAAPGIPEEPAWQDEDEDSFTTASEHTTANTTGATTPAHHVSPLLPPPQTSYPVFMPHHTAFAQVSLSELSLWPQSVTTTAMSTTPFYIPPLWQADMAEDEAVGGSADMMSDYGTPFEDFEPYNPDFVAFFGNLWNRQLFYNQGRVPRVTQAATKISEWAKTRPTEITERDVREQRDRGEGADVQGIDWKGLGLTAASARQLREREYINYRNIKRFVKEDVKPLKMNRHFYSFRRLDTAQACRRMHFQLRNVLGVTSRNDIFYGSESQVKRTSASTGSTRTLMDLSSGDFISATGNPIRISTLGAIGGSHGVVVAGGFHGEYALKAINAPQTSRMVTGIITEHENGITNHVQLISSRTSVSPLAVFSSNDSHIRILSCAPGSDGLRFLTPHPFDWAVNCSATSPDSRLRAVVGDSKDVLIVDADRPGRIEARLPGHSDFGFAVAWSDDGHTIATGNQDQTVRIFDARNFSRTVAVLPTRQAGCRALRFSPGGKLLAYAEPADFVHVVDASDGSWGEGQTIEFWGEVGGIEFSPDGRGEELWIANVDRAVGGLMEYGLCKGDDSARARREREKKAAAEGRRVLRERKRKERENRGKRWGDVAGKGPRKRMAAAGWNWGQAGSMRPVDDDVWAGAEALVGVSSGSSAAGASANIVVPPRENTSALPASPTRPASFPQHVPRSSRFSSDSDSDSDMDSLLQSSDDEGENSDASEEFDEEWEKGMDDCDDEETVDSRGFGFGYKGLPRWCRRRRTPPPSEIGGVFC